MKVYKINARDLRLSGTQQLPQQANTMITCFVQFITTEDDNVVLKRHLVGLQTLRILQDPNLKITCIFRVNFGLLNTQNIVEVRINYRAIRKNFILF